jgi:hypothetical protein
MPDLYQLPSVPSFYFKEDWEATGTLDFAGELDDVSEWLLGDPAITVERGRDQGRVTGGPKAPKLSLVLANDDGTFATERVDSPLHGLLGPGKLCRFGALVGTDVAIDDETVAIDDPEALIVGLADLPLMTGRTAEPGEKYQIGDTTVSVSAYGLMNRLIKNEISIPYQASITTGALAILAFQLAGLGPDEYLVDPDAIANGRRLLHYAADKRSAQEIVREAWATEGPPAAFYELADGRLAFEGRNYRSLTERCLVVQQTFLDIPSGRDAGAIDSVGIQIDDPRYDLNGEISALWHTDVGYEPSYGSVVNDVAITVEERALQPLAQVWQASGPIVLNANETREIFVTAASGDPLAVVATPVPTTDYTIGAGSLASLTATQLGGATVKLTLVAGPSGATVNPAASPAGLTGLQLRAQAAKVVSTQVCTGTIDATDSQGEFGKQGLPQELSIWKCLAPTEADGLADAYLLAYPRPRAVVTLTIENATGPLLLESFTREVGDLIHVVHARSGVDLDVTVELANHAASTGGRQKTTLTCERNVRLDWARYDVDRYDDPDALYGQ